MDRNDSTDKPRGWLATFVLAALEFLRPVPQPRSLNGAYCLGQDAVRVCADDVDQVVSAEAAVSFGLKLVTEGRRAARHDEKLGRAVARVFAERN